MGGGADRVLHTPAQSLSTWRLHHPNHLPREATHAVPSLAQNPARVRLWLEGEVQGSARMLLDAERIIFRSDARGRMVGTDRNPGAILMRAERWAMHRDGEAGAPKQLAYDIGGRS